MINRKNMSLNEYIEVNWYELPSVLTELISEKPIDLEDEVDRLETDLEDAEDKQAATQSEFDDFFSDIEYLFSQLDNDMLTIEEYKSKMREILYA